MKFTERLRTIACIITGAVLAVACGGGEPESPAASEPAVAVVIHVVVEAY